MSFIRKTRQFCLSSTPKTMSPSSGPNVQPPTVLKQVDRRTTRDTRRSPFYPKHNQLNSPQNIPTPLFNPPSIHIIRKKKTPYYAHAKAHANIAKHQNKSGASPPHLCFDQGCTRMTHVCMSMDCTVNAGFIPSPLPPPLLIETRNIHPK